jgi:hypothetical protein
MSMTHPRRAHGGKAAPRAGGRKKPFPSMREVAEVVREAAEIQSMAEAVEAVRNTRLKNPQRASTSHGSRHPVTQHPHWSHAEAE